VPALSERVTGSGPVADPVKLPRRRRKSASPHFYADSLAHDLWIADDPETLNRVWEFLSAHTSTPFCDACLARRLRLPIEDVRAATGRLAKTSQCEQGLWWCGACSTKGSVTVAIIGTR
jgi:hypothetical protein